MILGYKCAAFKRLFFPHSEGLRRVLEAKQEAEQTFLIMRDHMDGNYCVSKLRWTRGCFLEASSIIPRPPPHTVKWVTSVKNTLLLRYIFLRYILIVFFFLVWVHLMGHLFHFLFYSGAFLCGEQCSPCVLLLPDKSHCEQRFQRYRQKKNSYHSDYFHQMKNLSSVFKASVAFKWQQVSSVPDTSTLRYKPASW